MNLRVWLRNWLLKPSSAEVAASSASATTAGKLISGHLIRAHRLDAHHGVEVVYSFVDEDSGSDIDAVTKTASIHTRSE